MLLCWLILYFQFCEQPCYEHGSADLSSRWWFYLLSFPYIAISKTAGSYSSSIFNFLRNLHAIFLSGCNQFTFQLIGFLSSDPNQHLFLVFLMIAVLIGMRWYHSAVLISVYPCGWWVLYIPVSHVYVFFRKMCGLFIFWYWVVWILYGFWILTSCQIFRLQIFSPIS